MDEDLQLFEDELIKRASKFYAGFRKEKMLFLFTTLTHQSCFCAGEKPGMLDYMIWPWMERLPALRILSDGAFDFPKVHLPNLVNCP